MDGETEKKQNKGPIKIDINTRKSEAEWLRTIDDFWLKATPRWFQWLGWVLILGAFTFLNKNYESPIVTIVVGASYLALLFYLQALFYSIELYGIPFVKSGQIRRLISIGISGLLSIIVYVFLTKLIIATSGKI